ncbi:putative 3-phytase A precursor [Triangularia verruculosa]|uniref:Phytase A n=1 Tax=Triangularia verruculosa TaxID=2587418 RepID=A0AAN6XB71_9PEZI|nr:putative 3-phytase A precursor [Triangularia verruculosa]
MDWIRSLVQGGRSPEYTSLPDEELSAGQRRILGEREHKRKLRLLIVAMFVTILAILGLLFIEATDGANDPSRRPRKCDTPELGFQCDTSISHSWGQYSPYFAVPSEIDPAIPQGCNLTFAQVLSRHGARDPTFGKSVRYIYLVNRIQENATHYGPGFEFLKNHKYSLGADQLTLFGERQMVNSGFQFYNRYRSLASESIPFVRASDQNRVVVSAQNWTQGFHAALKNDGSSNLPHKPLPILKISEATGKNNTLSHGLCDAFERGGKYALVGDSAQTIYLSTFAPPIAARINANLPGVNLTDQDIISLMDLCPFDTVASPTGVLSPFCGLFTEEEWKFYDYYESLGKYYGYGPGNPLGPTQGVGWANELIARLTRKPVDDHTTTNSTLVESPETFPLDRELYADFSHDNDMMGILGALGVYDEVEPLSKTTRQEPEEVGGFSAAWTVAFGARIYVEKMACGKEKGQEEELVRILVNGRVVKPYNCGADYLGMCRLDKFVEGLEFARTGGKWEECWN